MDRIFKPFYIPIKLLYEQPNISINGKEWNKIINT